MVERALVKGAILFFLLPVLLASVGPVQAGSGARKSCGCYCGETTSPPCSDDKCIAACGGGGGGGGTTTAPAYDYEQERREREAREAREAQEQRRREKAERERKERERKRRKFLEDKEKALKQLKGTVGSEAVLKGRNTPIFGLKGVDAVDAGLKKSGRQAGPAVRKAWRQLHCGASISHYGIEVARKVRTKADLDEIHYLSGQALKALSGERLEVECAKVPDMPKISGSAPAKLKRFYPPLLKLVEKNAKLMFRTKPQLRERKKQTEKAEKKVKKLKLELKELEKQKVHSETKRRKRDAMALAIAALKKAKEAERAVETQRANAKAELDKIAEVNDKIVQGKDQAEDLYAELMGEFNEEQGNEKK